MNGELLSLVALFDDEDKFVKEAVLARLLENGEDSLLLLEEISLNENNASLKARIKELEGILKRELILSKFRANAQSGTLSLEAGIRTLCSLSSVSYESDYQEAFDSDVMELLTEISPQRTEVENIEIFNHIFFKRLRFSFTPAFDFSLDNTLFQEVVIGRKGNPVVISILYFLYASRAGLTIFPLTFPGGFIPVLLNSNGKIMFYLNIYKGGEIFLEDALNKYFEESGLKFDSTALMVRGDSYLIAIYAEIIRICYAKAGENENAELLQKIVILLGEEIPG